MADPKPTQAQRPPEAPKPAQDEKPTKDQDTKEEERTATELLQAAKLIDQEMERQARLCDAAHRLREAVGVPVQVVLEDLQRLEERSATLAKEIGRQEARMVEVNRQVAEGENRLKDVQGRYERAEADVKAELRAEAEQRA